MELDSKRSLLSKVTVDITFMVSIMLALGYATSYVYKIGYYNYFNVPLEFIDVKQSDLTPTLIVIITFLFLLWWKSNDFIYLKGDKTEKEINDLFKVNVLQDLKYSLFILPAIFVVMYVLMDMHFWISMISIFLIPILSILVSCAFTFLKNKYLFIFVLVISILGVSNFLGHHKAKISNVNYILQIKNKTDYIMIGIYKDKYIIAPIDLKNGIVSPSYQFVEIKSTTDNTVELHKKYTGELTVKKFAD